MTTEQVFVALLDEGTDVWRPVPAHRVGPDAFVLLRPDDYDPDDETWQFTPGSVVRCRPRRIGNADLPAAVERLKLQEKRTA
ncbi:MAG: hypothetical protein ACFCVE_01595 [Phycisphaerae bacterium]